MTRRLMPILILAILAIGTAAAPAAEPPPDLWVWRPVNFQVNEDVDRFIGLMERARKAGYGGVALSDYKFGKIDDRPDHYYVNMKRTREAAQRIGMELIPCVMPMGYSGSILMNNPDLAEGLPVKGCLIQVKGGLAVPPAAEDLLPGGALEKARTDRPEGWDWVDGFGTSTVLDTAVKHSGASSLRMGDFKTGNEFGNCRLVKKLTLKPFHQYHLRLWIKSQGLEADEIKVAVLAGEGRALQYAGLGVAPTQDWKLHDIVFNTLENSEVALYLGLWGGRAGTLWVDDLSLRLVGGVNLLRRDGCPVAITSEDGAIVYQEGKDYEPWLAPKTGRDPWPGEFAVYQEPSPVRILPGGSIKEGQNLRLSYYHAITVHEGQVAACLAAPELFEHLRRQVALIQEHFQPRRYFMQHDEIRVAGWCQSCRKEGVTAGQVLAENARRCTKIILDINPQAEIFVWSDMFDPSHNAVDNYYLVGSSLKNSWEGLSPSVGIMNWNGGQRRDSMAFFAGRGHPQIVAGYYDDADVAGQLKGWKDAAAGLKGIRGYMYTTWQGNYENLEKFADGVRAIQ